MMKIHNFEVGKQVETPSQLGKPEWADELRIAIPSRAKVYHLMYEILAQLEDEDEEIWLVLYGEML